MKKGVSKVIWILITAVVAVIVLAVSLGVLAGPIGEVLKQQEAIKLLQKEQEQKEFEEDECPLGWSDEIVVYEKIGSAPGGDRKNHFVSTNVECNVPGAGSGGKCLISRVHRCQEVMDGNDIWGDIYVNTGYWNFTINGESYEYDCIEGSQISGKKYEYCTDAEFIKDEGLAYSGDNIFIESDFWDLCGSGIGICSLLEHCENYPGGTDVMRKCCPNEPQDDGWACSKKKYEFKNYEFKVSMKYCCPESTVTGTWYWDESKNMCCVDTTEGKCLNEDCANNGGVWAYGKCWFESPREIFPCITVCASKGMGCKNPDDWTYVPKGECEIHERFGINCATCQTDTTRAPSYSGSRDNADCYDFDYADSDSDYGCLSIGGARKRICACE